jgi:transcriptional regulator with XRE-family HTH domain
MNGATAEHIGTRIKSWRRRRGGMSQETLAGLAGVSRPFITMVESGRRSVERRSTLVSIAQALQVSVADLLGQPSDLGDPSKAAASAAVPAIRAALLEIGEGERRELTRHPDELAAALDRVAELRNNADQVAIAVQLADLLLDAAACGGIALARAGYAAASCLRVLGYRDLALPAARIALAAAQDAEHLAWTGAARFAYVQAMPIEAAGLAQRLADRALTELQADAGDHAVRQVLGQLHLSAAFTSTVAEDHTRAADHLQAAEQEAATLGDPEDGRGFNSMGFGPTNVALWTMSVLAERGEYGKVIEAAGQVRPTPLRINIRHQSYWLDYGRSLAHTGRNDPQARAAFLRAEQAAPVPFSVNPMAHDTVLTMINRARHDAVPDDLRVLATRLGIEVSNGVRRR